MGKNVFHIVDTVTGETIVDGLVSRAEARMEKQVLEEMHKFEQGNRPVKPRYKVYMNGAYIH